MYSMYYVLCFEYLYMTFSSLQNSGKSSPKMQKMAFQTLDFKIFQRMPPDLPRATRDFGIHNVHPVTPPFQNSGYVPVE